MSEARKKRETGASVRPGESMFDGEEGDGGGAWECGIVLGGYRRRTGGTGVGQEPLDGDIVLCDGKCGGFSESDEIEGFSAGEIL